MAKFVEKPGGYSSTSNKLIHLVLLDFKQSQSAKEICLTSNTLQNGPTNQVLMHQARFQRHLLDVKL